MIPKLFAVWLLVAGMVLAPTPALAQGPAAGNVVPTSRRPPSVGAAAGIVLDAKDGSILWEKSARTHRVIASTTKIMTALVTLESTEPGEMVTASARAEAVGADDPLVTELELVRGEKLSVENLLYGLLLPSGSDVVVALAEHVGGSVEGFAALMNERARKAGATDSNFTNPDGLDDPAAYSTAYDLAQITRAAMANAEFRKIVATTRFSIPRQGGPPRDLVNRNELLAAGRKRGQDREHPDRGPHPRGIRRTQRGGKDFGDPRELGSVRGVGLGAQLRVQRDRGSWWWAGTEPGGR